MAIDALAAAAIGGAADVGAAGAAAGAADLGAVGATDLGGALGAASEADLTAAAATPSLTTGADIGVLDTGTAALDTGAAGANLAASDVAAGGSGVLADTGATAAAGDLAGTSGVLGGGDVFSGAGMASTGDLGTSFTGQPFGDVFSSTDTSVGAGGQGVSDIGSFGGGTTPPAPAGGNWAQAFPGVGENTGGQGFGAADQTSGGPMVTQGTGIVDTGPSLANTIQTPSAVSSGFEGSIASTDTSAAGFPTTTAQFNAYSPAVNNPLSADFSAFPNAGTSTSFETAFPGATNPATGMIAPQTPLAVENTLTGVPPNFVGGADFTGSQLNTMAATPLSAGGAYSPTGGVLATNEAFAPAAAEPLPPPTNVASIGPAANPVNTNPIPAAAAPANVPSSPPAVANAPAAAAGGIDPLTGLRMGAAGASIVASGINIANALNQPSYTALQPQYYPGSPFNPQPNAPGFPANNQVGGGIAGGLAANRLALGLMNGATPQQLAAQGLISPERATRLQSTYQGITEQYARQLGVSPQSLSPGVKQMIVARSLGDAGLGGR